MIEQMDIFQFIEPQNKQILKQVLDSYVGKKFYHNGKRAKVVYRYNKKASKSGVIASWGLMTSSGGFGFPIYETDCIEKLKKLIELNLFKDTNKSINFKTERIGGIISNNPGG